jgi:addiction module RelE/StbE family toxin
MREIIFKKQFKKDVERVKRTGRPMNRLAEAIDLLAESKPLPTIIRDHQLVGNMKDYRECHLGGDWLHIYQLFDDTVSFIQREATPNSSTDMRYKFIIYWSTEDQAFLVEVPELPGCMADGSTYEEAVANAQSVIAGWIETAGALGRPIPEPKGKLSNAWRICGGMTLLPRQ